MIQLKSTKLAASNGLNVMAYGPSGAGKTSLIASLAQEGFNPLVLSAEAGLLPLRQHEIPFIEIDSIATLDEAFAFVSQSEEASQFDWICLDSISEIAEVILAAEKKLTKDPRQAYTATSDQVTDYIRKFRDLKQKNVYFSCKQERIKDELSGALLYGPSAPGNKLAQSLPYHFDEVFALRVEKDQDGQSVRWLQTSACAQYSAKDRSGALDQFEQPNLGAIAKKINA